MRVSSNGLYIFRGLALVMFVKKCLVIGYIFIEGKFVVICVK